MSDEAGSDESSSSSSSSSTEEESVEKPSDEKKGPVEKEEDPGELIKKIIAMGRELLQEIKKSIKESISNSLRKVLLWLEKNLRAAQTLEEVEAGAEEIDKEHAEIEQTLGQMEKEVELGRQKFEKRKQGRKKAVELIEKFEKELGELAAREELLTETMDEAKIGLAKLISVKGFYAEVEEGLWKFEKAKRKAAELGAQLGERMKRAKSKAMPKKKVEPKVKAMPKVAPDVIKNKKTEKGAKEDQPEEKKAKWKSLDAKSESKGAHEQIKGRTKKMKADLSKTYWQC